MNGRRRRFLKATIAVGHGLELRIVERPGLSLEPDACAALLRDVRAVAATELPEKQLGYGVLGGDRERLENTVVALLVEKRTGRPVGFNALAPLDLELAGREIEALHLGLVIVDPAYRGRGLTDLLTGLTCLVVLLRGRCRPIVMSNVTQVPSVVGLVATVFSDVFPTPERPRDPSFTHRTLARQILARHRHVFGVGDEAGFDEARSVLTNAYTGGSDELKKTFASAPKHRRAVFNEMCARELDYDRGDDFLQIGRIDVGALRRYLSTVATPQSLPWLLGQFALIAVQSALLPALHWFAPDEPFGALRPREERTR